MDTNYPENADPRPKRRKDKDNPYTIYSIGRETDHPQYFAQFTDGEGIDHCQEISKDGCGCTILSAIIPTDCRHGRMYETGGEVHY